MLNTVSTVLLNYADESNLPLIHWAALQNEMMAAKLAIKLDPACVNEFNESHGTPLHVAVFERYENMVQFLLEKGADPNAVDPNVETEYDIEPVLHLALSTVGGVRLVDKQTCVEQHIVMLLLEWEADPNAVIENGINALLHAARLGLPEIVATILRTGNIDINSHDDSGATALHIAVRRFQPHGVPEVLLDYGIDIDAENVLGQTALFHTSTPVSTKLLVQCGARVDVVDKSQRTVLHYLASRRFPSSAVHARHIMSSLGIVDMNLKDVNGQTAIDIAKAKGNIDLQNLLEEYK